MKPIRSICVAALIGLLTAVAATAQTVPITGEADVSNIQANVDAISQRVYDLENRVAAIEQGDSDPAPAPDPVSVTDGRLLGINTGFVDAPFSPDIPYLADGTLDHDYVKLMTPIASTIRFMDWNRINGDLAFYTQLDETWRGRLDQQVRLANACNADLWLNVPFHASEAWTTQAVAFIRARLNAEHVILVEWSNEPWNTGFNTYQQLKREAGTDAGSGAGLAFFELWADYMDAAFRGARAADPDCLLVLGGHPASVWWTERVYERLDVKPDAVATTFYIGPKPKDTLADVQTARQLIERARSEWEDGGEAKMRETFAFAEREGLDVFGYEGGHHLAAPYINGKPDQRIAALVIEAQHDPAILDLMALPLDLFIELGGKRACFYKFVSVYDQYGAWGLARSVAELPGSIKYQWAVKRSQAEN